MQRFFVLFTVLSIFLFSVLAAPLPLDQSLDKRQNYSGRGTWFDDTANESACSTWNNNNQMIVALSKGIFASSHCGQSVWITANGKSVSATVGDECEGCGDGDLDMSEGLFQQFADLSVGVLSITWNFS